MVALNLTILMITLNIKLHSPIKFGIMNKKVRLLTCYPQKSCNINGASPLQCYLHLCIPLKLMIDYIFFPKSTHLQFSDYKNDTNA